MRVTDNQEYADALERRAANPRGYKWGTEVNQEICVGHCGFPGTNIRVMGMFHSTEDIISISIDQYCNERFVIERINHVFLHELLHRAGLGEPHCVVGEMVARFDRYFGGNEK